MASNRKISDMARANHAWDCVKKVKDSNIEKGKYGSKAKDLGAMIMTDGLGAALAFLRSKNEDKPEGKATWELYRNVSQWVTAQMGRSQNATAQAQGSDDLLQRLMQGDTAYYRRATTEALAYVLWLKRFVEGEFGKEIVKEKTREDSDGKLSDAAGHQGGTGEERYGGQ